MSKGVLLFYFDYTSACLWAGDSVTIKELGVGPVDDCLPLSEALRSRIEEVGYEQSGYLNLFTHLTRAFGRKIYVTASTQKLISFYAKSKRSWANNTKF